MDVLLVEDDASLADVIARNLRARGVHVSVAPTGEAAFGEMATTWPDVLVVDINLPDLTGWDILRRISPEDRKRLPVVVISSGALSQKRIEELHPERSLEKPFPMDALARILAEFRPAVANADGASSS
jgi:DNA-binding response OmpR family regulator